jgi:ubiquinone/menaquinone biosynthesis C-methylase UbiE
LEPEIIAFGEFEKFNDKKTLEVGVGLGSDHMLLAQAGAILTGVDLTHRAIEHTKRRFELLGLKSNLIIADAENLPFSDNEFDAIYSWGVLHHSPNTQKAIDEVYRVLKPGGFAKIMIYHKFSLVGYMLWIRYGLMKLNPFISLTYIYHHYLESPGTKAYSYAEVRKLFDKFNIIELNSPLSHGDLLTSEAGQRHRGTFLNIAQKIWPRWFFLKFMPNHGLWLMISLEKGKII